MTATGGNGAAAARDGHIRILPIHVANKIAAGEVVERPASALKELVENSIDAGADRIDIAITAGGRKLVSVRDNGCGMNREDALLSLERQATSKIRDVDDIERIDTLGFRGEAVPSIAAVSRFTLTTRRKDDDSGTRLVVNAGVVAEVSECGAPPGTCVEVRDLFCNVPARRKFLRSYVTEESHIKSAFTTSAISHPEIGFSLSIDGREIYRCPPGSTLEERIACLFGCDFTDGLVAIGGEARDGASAAGAQIGVYGYVSRPSQDAMRREQFIFVNGRPATAPIIAYAIKEAYPCGRGESRPSLFLFIELPPRDVDVNVHPAKREVRFRHPVDVKSAIVSAISAGLCAPPPQRHGISAPVPDAAAASPAKPSAPAPLSVNAGAATAGPPFSVPFQPSLPARPNRQPAAPGEKSAPPPESPPRSAPEVAPATAEPSSAPATSGGPWRFFKVLACTESGYMLIETDAGIVTLNPQAAQERIAYEKLMSAFDGPSDGDPAILSQPLLIPETIHLSPLESARLANFKGILEKQGFEIEEFGNGTWKIDAVPAILAGHDATAAITSVVYDIGEAGSKRGDRWREELIARSVARSLAGASRKFTPEGAARLVEELGRTKRPYECPRGRPVMIFTSNRELARKFGG